MTRWTLAGCLALAALGAGAVLDVGSSTAEAAPSVSPFAGTYVGADPRGLYPSWKVTIADGGQIAGLGNAFPGGRSSISGQVTADGSYSFEVKRTSIVDGTGERNRWGTVKYKSAGSIAFDAVGNIVGTASTGLTFSWLRQ